MSTHESDTTVTPELFWSDPERASERAVSVFVGLCVDTDASVELSSTPSFRSSPAVSGVNAFVSFCDIMCTV